MQALIEVLVIDANRSFPNVYVRRKTHFVGAIPEDASLPVTK